MFLVWLSGLLENERNGENGNMPEKLKDNAVHTPMNNQSKYSLSVDMGTKPISKDGVFQKLTRYRSSSSRAFGIRGEENLDSSSVTILKDWMFDKTKEMPTHPNHHHQRHGHRNNKKAQLGGNLPTVHYSKRVNSRLKAAARTSNINDGDGEVGIFGEMPPVPLAITNRVTGPYFESNQNTLHVSAKAGDSVVLECIVIMLQGRTVSSMLDRINFFIYSEV